MKTMNMVMPLMSAFFCFTFPVGLGIYWIASAVVRSAQQFAINRHLDKMNIDDLVNENMKKIEAKRAKEDSAAEDHQSRLISPPRISINL